MNENARPVVREVRWLETDRPEMSARVVLPRPKRFYTVPEAAELLTVSTPTLYREIREGRFPAIKVRGRYVVPAKAVDAMEQAALATGLVDPGDFVYASTA